MSQVNVIRAWKDEEYRNSLTDAERAQLPENPAGLTDLTEAELRQLGGGAFIIQTAFVCWFQTMLTCTTQCGVCLNSVFC